MLQPGKPRHQCSIARGVQKFFSSSKRPFWL